MNDTLLTEPTAFYQFGPVLFKSWTHFLITTVTVGVCLCYTFCVTLCLVILCVRMRRRPAERLTTGAQRPVNDLIRQYNDKPTGTRPKTPHPTKKVSKRAGVRKGTKQTSSGKDSTKRGARGLPAEALNCKGPEYFRPWTHPAQPAHGPTVFRRAGDTYSSPSLIRRPGSVKEASARLAPLLGASVGQGRDHGNIFSPQPNMRQLANENDVILLHPDYYEVDMDGAEVTEETSFLEGACALPAPGAVTRRQRRRAPRALAETSSSDTD